MYRQLNWAFSWYKVVQLQPPKWHQKDWKLLPFFARCQVKLTTNKVNPPIENRRGDKFTAANRSSFPHSSWEKRLCSTGVEIGLIFLCTGYVSFLALNWAWVKHWLDQFLEGNDRRQVFPDFFALLSVLSFKENRDFLIGEKGLKKHELEDQLETSETTYVPPFLKTQQLNSALIEFKKSNLVCHGEKAQLKLSVMWEACYLMQLFCSIAYMC